MTEEETTEETTEEETTKPDPAPKMVLESDLLTIKTQLGTAKEKLTTAETESVSWQSKFNTASTQSKTQATELETLKTVQGDLDKLKEKSEGDSKLLTTAVEALVTKSKDLITSRFPKLPKEKLDGKSQEQLDIMLDTLEDVAPSGHRPNDPGPSGGGNGATPLEIAAQEMAAAKVR